MAQPTPLLDNIGLSHRSHNDILENAARILVWLISKTSQGTSIFKHHIPGLSKETSLLLFTFERFLLQKMVHICPFLVALVLCPPLSKPQSKLNGRIGWDMGMTDVYNWLFSWSWEFPIITTRDLENNHFKWKITVFITTYLKCDFLPFKLSSLMCSMQ